MTRSELVAGICRRKPHLLTRDVDAIVDMFFDEVSLSLINDRRVEFRGFGSFSIRRHRARLARSPSGGKSVEIPERRFPHFKAGGKLLERLNDRG